jgi:hypothetical protein
MKQAFEEAFNGSEEVIVNENPFLRWNVLSLDDLITSKIKASRPKDLLNVQQLLKFNNK